MTARFTFASARITGHTPDGTLLPTAVLDLSVHGLLELVPDDDSRCGERFDLRLALVEQPALPETDAAWGHDLLLWSPSPDPVFRGHQEVWLHRVSLRPRPTDRSGCVGLSGSGWGRSFHLEAAPPVPLDTNPVPGWITQPTNHSPAGS